MNRPRRAGPSELPVPDPAAREHSRRLVELIRSEIDAAGGIISFRRYMELALYAPGLGYYSAGSVKFGPHGDFTTAPELSSLFSSCVARQCAEILGTLGGVILEFGAGSGALAAGVLRSLDASGRLPDEYLILEPSADLRVRQQEFLHARLGRVCERVRWLDAMPERPLKGVVLANEVLDAMPVHRLRFDETSIEELGVCWNGTGFAWKVMPPGPELIRYVWHALRETDRLPSGYTTEFNTVAGAWIASVAAVVEQGAVLLFDYGYPRREYYHPDRAEGTLVCHYRHRAHSDPFLHPGLQDISASVDFTMVAEHAAAAGLTVGGFTTQAHFLIGCGVHELPEFTVAADERARLELARQLKLLTLPGEMGERFKAMALLRGVPIPPAGFRSADHRRRL
jgi:SAM-dependent MidA family methyltransferase